MKRFESLISIPSLLYLIYYFSSSLLPRTNWNSMAQKDPNVRFIITFSHLDLFFSSPPSPIPFLLVKVITKLHAHPTSLSLLNAFRYIFNPAWTRNRRWDCNIWANENFWLKFPDPFVAYSSWENIRANQKPPRYETKFKLRLEILEANFV